MTQYDINKVQLFITCLIDNFFPEVGEAMVKVFRRLGIEVCFVENQTCCGQPAFNSGYHSEAKDVAKYFIETFSDVRYPIVCPSGSCTSMIKNYYLELFKSENKYLEQVEKISSNFFEFSDFLVNKLGKTDVGASYNKSVTYHDSCHSLRELGLKNEPRKLINSVKGIEFNEMDMNDACCGFGGTFSLKYPEVSISMLEEKADCIFKSGATTVVSNDMGCLMNIKGYTSRNNLSFEIIHLAELLAKSD